jgi:hypothetical protein
MVMAIWLIVKGFNLSAIDARSGHRLQSIQRAYQYAGEGHKKGDLVVAGHNGRSGSTANKAT